MRTIRRRTAALALATLIVQAIVLIAATARVCHGGGHTHGGDAAADCPLHHQQPSGPSPHAGHHDHGVPEDAGPRVRCDCSTDVQSFLAGDSAVVAPSRPIGPPQIRAAAMLNGPTAAIERWQPPLAPPPRPRLS
jgi:hypothetical protein